MAGLKLYPSEVENQCNDMIHALESNKDILSAVEANIEDFVTNESLDGNSWRTMKAQMENHQYAIRAIILAEDKIIEDCRFVMSGLGTDTLIEDDLKSDIEHLALANEHLGAANAQYQHMMTFAAGMPTSTAMVLQNNIQENNYRIAENIFAIEHKQLQLTTLYEVEAATSNRFSDAADLLNQAKGIISDLGKAWSGGPGNFSPVKLTKVKTHDINKKWTKRYIRDVEKAGIKGLDSSRAEMLMELGYTPEKISIMMASCENDSDREFLKDMLTGDYDSAFRVCPFRAWGKHSETGLSDSVKIYMAEFATELYEEMEQNGGTKESSVELVRFTNAIYTDIYVDRYRYEVIKNPFESYTGEYLKCLYSGTDVNVESRVALLKSRDFTQNQFEKLAKKQYQYMTMEGYWSSQYEIYKENQGQFSEPKMEIDNIRMDAVNHSITFDMTIIREDEYHFKKEEKYSLGSDVLEIPSDMVDAHYAEDISELQKEAEELWENCFSDTCVNAGLALLSVTVPEIGIPLTAMKALLEHENADAAENVYDGVKTVCDVGDEMEGKLDSLANPVLSIYSDIEDYKAQKQAIKKEIDNRNAQYIDEQFGSGIQIANNGTRQIIKRGIIDPKEAYLWGKWEREGLSAFTSIDKKEYDLIEKRIDDLVGNPKANVDVETAKNMKILLRGGGEHCIEKMPVKELWKAHELLNNEVLRKYEKSGCGKVFSISEAFKQELGKDNL